MKKQPIEEIYTKIAMERLHLTRKAVLDQVKAGKLNGRLMEAPRPYYLIAVDSKFLAEEQKRAQVAA
jgi:hypothetical protein